MFPPYSLDIIPEYYLCCFSRCTCTFVVLYTHWIAHSALQTSCTGLTSIEVTCHHCTGLPPIALFCHPLHWLATLCTVLPPTALACHPLNWLATHCSAYLLNFPLILVISFSICYLPTPSNNPTPHSKALTWRLGPLIQQPLLHICSSSSKSIPRTISSIKSSSLGPADFLRVGLLRL